MDVVIIGAGVAGLVAAATLARAGRAVTVFERAAEVGGRAATTVEGGYALNRGPHALYTRGATARALDTLGVRVSGHDPGNVGHVLYEGALHALPGSPWSFLTTGLFTTTGRLQALGFVRRLLLADDAALDRVSVEHWLAPVTDPAAAAWARAMVRLFTYANDPGAQSAGAFVRQGRLGLRGGVRYLDGGWDTLVRPLCAAATAAGATIQTGAEVDGIDTSSGPPRVRVDGAWRDARAVLVATTLPAARRLLPELPTLPGVRAACLDLALSPGPARAARFILGVDRPLYVSVHSETAALAPPGGAVVHAAHYLAPGDHADLAELEALVDRAVPGWRDRVVTRRWLPALTVASALNTAVRPRPGVHVRDRVWAAGDWVGDEGELVDTSTASALAASRAILATAP